MRKKLARFTILFLLACIFMSCSKPQATGESIAATEITASEIPAAVEDGSCGQRVVHDGYIYFVSPSYNDRASNEPEKYGVSYICKMKLDGSEFKTLYQSKYIGDGTSYQTSDIYGIAIYDNTLYYYDSESLGKMTLDGEILHKYENTNYHFIEACLFYIYNDNIYYLSNTSDGFGYGSYNLFRMNLDGSDVQLLQTMAEEFTIDPQNERIICFVPGFNEDPEEPQTESIVQMGLDGENKTALIQYPVEWDTRGNGEKYWRALLRSPYVLNGDIYYAYGLSGDIESFCFSPENGAQPLPKNFLYYDDQLDFLTDEQMQLFAKESEEVSILGATASHIFFTLETYDHIHNDNADICMDIYTAQLYELDRSTNAERLLFDIDHNNIAKRIWRISDLLHITDDCLYFDGLILRRDGTGSYYAESENGAMTYYSED